MMPSWGSKTSPLPVICSDCLASATIMTAYKHSKLNTWTVTWSSNLHLMCGINGWRQVKEDWESELMTDCCGSTTCRYIDTEGVDIQSAVVTWICGLIVSTTYSLQPHSEPSTAMKFKPHCTVQHPNRFRRAFVGRCMRTSSRRRYLSVRQFFANSTADRVSWPAKAEGSWASVTLHISLTLTPKNPVVHIFRIQNTKIQE